MDSLNVCEIPGRNTSSALLWSWEGLVVVTEIILRCVLCPVVGARLPELNSSGRAKRMASDLGRIRRACREEGGRMMVAATATPQRIQQEKLQKARHPAPLAGREEVGGYENSPVILVENFASLPGSRTRDISVAEIPRRWPSSQSRLTTRRCACRCGPLIGRRRRELECRSWYIYLGRVGVWWAGGRQERKG